ncbi:MAG: acyl-CoA dehydrogenase [Pseudomonadales bacterium]|nr:acyl-CoA dehydrogenase [Pseudomonadales bacterium]
MPDNLPLSLLKIRSSMEDFIASNLSLESDELEFSDGRRRDIITASKAAGFYYKTQSQEFGGQPANLLELTMLREQLAATNSIYARFVFGPGPGVLHQARGKLKQDYLDPLMRGEKQMAFGFTEPEDADRPTFAVLDNSHLTLTGRKSYVTEGASADFISVLVNLEDTIGKKLGTLMVVVDKDAQGVSIENAFTSLDGGAHLAMGFDAVQVPVDNMVGKPGEGMPRALKNIADVRLMVAAESIGICLWVLAYLEKKLTAKHRSGHALADREGVRLRYADLRIETYVGRSVLYRTARLAIGKENSVNEISACKIYCTELAGRVVDQAVQLSGGQALITGHPLEKLYRQVRSLRFVEGANDLLRLNIAKGKFDLGLGKL